MGSAATLTKLLEGVLPAFLEVEAVLPAFNAFLRLEDLVSAVSDRNKGSAEERSLSINISVSINRYRYP